MKARNADMQVGFLVFIGLFLVIKEIYKEKRQPHIPADNWKNSKLIHEDTFVNQISSEEFQKNLLNGKYK